MIRFLALTAILFSGCASSGGSSRLSQADSSDTDCAKVIEVYRADYDIKQKRIDELIETSNDGPLISQAITAGVQASADLAEVSHRCDGSDDRNGL